MPLQNLPGWPPKWVTLRGLGVPSITECSLKDIDVWDQYGCVTIIAESEKGVYLGVLKVEPDVIEVLSDFLRRNIGKRLGDIAGQDF